MSSTNGKENWGSSVLRTRVSREPYLLDKKTFADIKYWEWALIIASLIFIVTNIGFCIFHVVLGTYIFPILLIINNCFGVYFLFHGVLKELPFQVFMQFLTKTLLWVLDLLYFLALPDKEKEEPLSGTEEEESTEDLVKKIRFYVSSALLGLNLPIALFVIWKYTKTNATVFRAVGTEPRYVKLYKQQSLGRSLLAFDAEVALLLVFLIGYKLVKYDSAKDRLPLDAMVLLPVGLVFITAWVLLGHIAMKRESRILTYIFYVASHLQPIYVIYLCIAIPSVVRKGSLLYITTFTIGVFYYVLHALLLYAVVRIQLSYGQGLKQAANKQMATLNRMRASLPEEEFLQTTLPPPQQTDL